MAFLRKSLPSLLVKVEEGAEIQISWKFDEVDAKFILPKFVNGFAVSIDHSDFHQSYFCPPNEQSVKIHHLPFMLPFAVTVKYVTEGHTEVTGHATFLRPLPEILPLSIEDCVVGQTQLKISWTCGERIHFPLLFAATLKQSSKVIRSIVTEKCSVIFNDLTPENSYLFSVHPVVDLSHLSEMEKDFAYHKVTREIGFHNLQVPLQDNYDLRFNFFDVTKDSFDVERVPESQIPKSGTVQGGHVIAFLGMYDVGKTYTLNKLTGCNLPSGKDETTMGISVKTIEDKSKKLTFLDTAGMHSPLQISASEQDDNEKTIQVKNKLVAKKSTERFLEDIVFELADYVVVVINDLTWPEQEYLEALRVRLSNSKRAQVLYVIHNLKTIERKDILHKVWDEQLKTNYHTNKTEDDGVTYYTSMVSYKNKGGTSLSQDVQTIRHLCLAKEGSEAGIAINDKMIRLLKSQIHHVIPTVNNFSIEKVLKCANQSITTVMGCRSKTSGGLELVYKQSLAAEDPGVEEPKKRRPATVVGKDRIKTTASVEENKTVVQSPKDIILGTFFFKGDSEDKKPERFLKNSLNFTQTGASMTTSDFEAKYDKYETEQDLIILIDVPGFVLVDSNNTSPDCPLWVWMKPRKGVDDTNELHVKGTRSKTETSSEKNNEKNEINRQFGTFHLVFKDDRWVWQKEVNYINGVLRLHFKRPDMEHLGFAPPEDE
eukprot:Lithocolla_globosa_v1_NODE_1766_length_2353_cov_87.258921.p1 type:complete len:712 gc:universal NODE_1766_length_2353_cov_87.258921:2190-55(-)